MEQVVLDRARIAAARTVVGGYTGRDEEQVRHHIDELARIGVSPPDQVPEFYAMPANSLSFADELEVDSEHTSGEVEPVLIRLDGQLYLGLGSDHTDRKVEADVGVAASKLACPKPLSTAALRCTAHELDELWDSIALACRVDGTTYQSGRAADLRPVTETLALFEERIGAVDSDLVLYGGTVPLLTGEFIFGDHWEMTLQTPQHAVHLTYRIRVRTQQGATRG